jgi:hypothetical protein
MRLGARLLLLGGAVVAAASPPSIAWAHGVGVRGDLPVPASLAAAGAAVVLVASFAALAALWPRPRLAAAATGRPVPGGDRVVGWLAWPLRLLGVAAFIAAFGATLAGPGDPTQNFAAVAIYVGLWVGVLVASAVLGDVWSALSPFETAAAVGRLSRGHHPDAAAQPLSRAGVWPGVVLLAGFVWLELVHPTPGEPTVLLAAMALYTGVIAVGALWWGRGWIRSAEGFGVLFRLVAAMAPLHRNSGRLRLRWPLTGLTRVEASPSTTALILLVLGATTFDGVTRQPFWQALAGEQTGWAAVPLATAGLVVTVEVVAGVYWLAMREGARITERRTGELAHAFAHSLVPIVVAYAIAHYFSLLAFQGQQLLALASDPLDAGWNLLGTAHWSVDYALISPTAIAWVQVGAIVLGHVAGVVLAHDRAVALLPGPTATRSQVPLLFAMVVYTIGGLLLLLSGG